MRMIIELMHLGDQAVYTQATARIDDVMYKMGFTRVGVLDSLKLRTLYYDIRDRQTGVRPEFLASRIVELNDQPSVYRVEGKLVAHP